MKKKRRGPSKARVAAGWQVPLWAILGPVIALVVAAGLWSLLTPQASPAAAFQKLRGQWLRPDGGYVLTIQSVGEDGTAVATYSNPNPVHVSKAKATSKDGTTNLFIELRDEGYPGNTYELEYDAAGDRLTGVYQHLGLGQTFDVAFQRQPTDESRKP